MDEIEKLEKTNIDVLDEILIRQAIYYLRKKFNKKCENNSIDEIIESNEDGGYQIGSKVALI